MVLFLKRFKLKAKINLKTLILFLRFLQPLRFLSVKFIDILLTTELQIYWLFILLCLINQYLLSLFLLLFITITP